MTGKRQPFALAPCLFLRGHALISAPVPPFRAASHAEGDPCALLAVSPGAEAAGAALARVLHAGLAGWTAPLFFHDGAAAIVAAQAAQADLAKAAKASKAQAKAETGMVWATADGNGRVLFEPTKQARGTLAFDGLPFRLQASLEDAGETGRALLAAIALCRGSAAFEGTLPAVGVVDLAWIGEVMLVAPRTPARSEPEFLHPSEVVDMAKAGPQALDAALARAIRASRSGTTTDRPARATGHPKAASAKAVNWTLAEVAGSGVWHGPTRRRPGRAGDALPIWRALPEAPDGTHAKTLLGAMSATQGNA